MFIPFEPAIPFTLIQLIVWYLLLCFCSALGAASSILCETPTNTKIVIGVLYGMTVYYALSWLFQSRAAMSLAKYLNVVVT